MTDEKSTDKPKTQRRTARTEDNSVQEPTPIPAPSVSFNQDPNPRVIMGGDRDPVYITKIIPFNKAARKSLSVRHLQYRLAELGYTEALTDNEGYYGDSVQSAVSRYQEAHDLLATGQPDVATISSIFEGDDAVDLHLA
jgi:hypothetical protein